MSNFTYKVIKSENEEVGIIEKYNANGVLVDSNQFDLTDETKLDDYATQLVEHIGGGGIKKSSG